MLFRFRLQIPFPGFTELTVGLHLSAFHAPTSDRIRIDYIKAPHVFSEKYVSTQRNIFIKLGKLVMWHNLFSLLIHKWPQIIFHSIGLRLCEAYQRIINILFCSMCLSHFVVSGKSERTFCYCIYVDQIFYFSHKFGI